MTKNITKIFSANLKKYRQERKITQQKLAELAEIEYKYIQRLEGKNAPAVRIDTVERLSRILKVKPADLLS